MACSPPQKIRQLRAAADIVTCRGAGRPSGEESSLLIHNPAGSWNQHVASSWSCAGSNKSKDRFIRCNASADHNCCCCCKVCAYDRTGMPPRPATTRHAATCQGAHTSNQVEDASRFNPTDALLLCQRAPARLEGPGWSLAARGGAGGQTSTL